MFYDALQDLRAMRLLESLIGREEALEIVTQGEELTFKSYPHQSSYILAMRERVNSTIKEHIKDAPRLQ